MEPHTSRRMHMDPMTPNRGGVFSCNPRKGSLPAFPVRSIKTPESHRRTRPSRSLTGSREVHRAAAGFGEQSADFGERNNGDSTSRRSYPADFGEQANI
jgi:hypothetical protein